MAEFIKKLYWAGLGALTLTQEKIESLTEDLIKKGELTAQERAGFVAELINNVEKSRQELQALVKKEVQKGLNSLDIPTRAEFDELKKRIAELEQNKN